MSGYTRELDDGTVVYSASSIGYCSAALYYDRLGVTHEAPPENIQRAWAEGHDNEALILRLLEQEKVWKVQDKDWLTADGWWFGEFDPSRNQDYSDQVRVEKKVGQGVVVRAHLDGIATIESYPSMWIENDEIYRVIEAAEGKCIVEAKAFGDSYFDKWKRDGLAAFPTYEWQVSVQMHASGLPCEFIVGKKDKAGVVQFIDHRLIITPPISWGKIAAKISRIEAAVKNKQTPKCEEPIMFPCPFYPMHDAKVDIFGQDTGAAAEIQLTDEAAKSVDVYAARFLAHEKLAKEHEAEAKVAKERLLEYLAANGESSVPILGEQYRIVPKPGGRKGSVDAQLLAKDGIDVDKYRKAGSSWVSIDVVKK